MKTEKKTVDNRTHEDVDSQYLAELKSEIVEAVSEEFKINIFSSYLTTDIKKLIQDTIKERVNETTFLVRTPEEGSFIFRVVRLHKGYDITCRIISLYTADKLKDMGLTLYDIPTIFMQKNNTVSSVADKTASIVADQKMLTDNTERIIEFSSVSQLANLFEYYGYSRMKKLCIEISAIPFNSTSRLNNKNSLLKISAAANITAREFRQYIAMHRNHNNPFIEEVQHNSITLKKASIILGSLSGGLFLLYIIFNIIEFFSKRPRGRFIKLS